MSSVFSSYLVAEGQVISDDWRDVIESFLLDVDSRTSAEIVVYIVDSLWGHGIEKDGSELNEIVSLGVYIFNELVLDIPGSSVVGIGKEDLDNGVLVLIAMEEREWRIEIGYGLEGFITDIESYHIANESLVPKFKQERYSEGVADTVEALSLLIPELEEPNSKPVRGRYVYDLGDSPDEEDIPTWVIVIIIIFVILFFVLGGRSTGYGRRGGHWGGGGGSGGGGGGGSGGGGSGGGW